MQCGVLIQSITSPLLCQVELSSIISESGSSDQETHSDVPLSAPLILSAFIALTHVTLENGPTCMYEGSHTAAFHHAKAESVANVQKYYSTDGYDEEILEYEATVRAANTTDTQRHTEAEETSAAYPAYCAVLEPGDMLLFDTKIAHRGMANGSLLPRSLLCFAFQQPAPAPALLPALTEDSADTRDQVGASAIKKTDAKSPSRRHAPKVEGFTYHCHDTMTQERIILEDYI